MVAAHSCTCRQFSWQMRCACVSPGPGRGCTCRLVSIFANSPARYSCACVSPGPDRGCTCKLISIFANSPTRCSCACLPLCLHRETILAILFLFRLLLRCPGRNIWGMSICSSKPLMGIPGERDSSGEPDRPGGPRRSQGEPDRPGGPKESQIGRSQEKPDRPGGARRSQDFGEDPGRAR